MLESLLHTYEDEPVLEEAVQEYLARSRASRPNQREQLAAIQAVIRRSEEALDRYFNTFEAGKMNEYLCRPGIEALTERLRALRALNSELGAAIED